MKNKEVRICRVISLDDPYGAGRIKVRLQPEDDAIDNDSKLPYAIPLLPKMFYVQPKVGEMVLTLLEYSDDGNSQRYFVGPVISQWDFMRFDTMFFGSDSIFENTAPKNLIANINNYAESRGVLPDQDTVAILGRKNCDIHITEDDVRIRAGVKVVDENSTPKICFNDKDPAYIKMKYHSNSAIGGGEIGSTATIVANQINLLSNKSNRRRPLNGNNQAGEFHLSDREHLVTDKELETIANEAYRLPYGEELLNFLKKFIDIFNKHTHNYVGLPPNDSFIEALNSAASDPITNEKMLSNSIKIN